MPISFCPSLLMCSSSLPIQDVDSIIYAIATDYIDFAKKNNINIEYSLKVLSYILETYPWNDCHGNDELRQRQSLWYKNIICPLQKYGHSIPQSDSCRNRPCRTTTCSISGNDINCAWSTWLENWADGPMVSSFYLKGIFCDKSCITKMQNHLCASFIQVYDTTSKLKLLHPIYIKYPNNLPVTGRQQFIPPQNWENQPLQKGNGGGYIDINGWEWIWDRMHGDHWDVQIPNDYLRVTPSGIVLD